jgi:hypothetical protein
MKPTKPQTEPVRRPVVVHVENLSTGETLDLVTSRHGITLRDWRKGGK